MNRVQTRSATTVPSLTMILPVPFGQVLPALVVMLLAVAYMEEDGLALLLSLLNALASLTITAGTIWGTVVTVDWLDSVTRRLVQVALRIRS